jgi:prepilin-type N-terminal cleavage/methylation domain-containing protein
MLTPMRVEGTNDHDPQADHGFTLVEMLVTISVVGIIMLALVAVMFGSMKSNIDTKVRLDETRDQQFAASYFGPDASAATSVLRDVTAGCGPGTAAIEFRGASYDSITLAPTVTVVSYIFDTATVDGKPAGQLRRQACEAAASPPPAYPLVIKSAQFVARNLATTAPVFACTPAPPAVCGPTTTSVTLTAARRSGDAPFLLVGTRRTTA